MSWATQSASTSSYGMASALSSGTPAPTVAAPPEAPKPKSSLATLAERLAGVSKVPKVEKVCLDGLVVMKIIKHCTESLPDFCEGTLLGMDVDSKLEVTNCFSLPNASEDSGEDSVSIESFNADMINLLKDINIDSSKVGWYTSNYMGNFCTKETVEKLVSFQDKLDQESAQKAVIIVYDPFQTKRGSLSLKAFRLTDEFLKMHRESKASGSTHSVVKLSASVVAQIGGLQGDGSAQVASQDLELSAEEIFEELPVEITNAHLFTVLIDDLKQRSGDTLDVDFDRLNLGTNTYLGNSLDNLLEKTDTLASEQSKRNMEKRRLAKTEQDQVKWLLQRRAENMAREERGEPLLPEVDAFNPLFRSQPPTSQLEALLIQKQISIYTQQINRFAGAGFSKLYLAGAIQGKKLA